MNSNLLIQMLQTMQSNEHNENTPDMQMLPPPFDTLQSLRHLLPPREQRVIDIMIKFHELRMLIDDLHNEI